MCSFSGLLEQNATLGNFNSTSVLFAGSRGYKSGTQVLGSLGSSEALKGWSKFLSIEIAPSVSPPHQFSMHVT